MPTKQYWHTRIFRPSVGPDMQEGTAAQNDKMYDAFPFPTYNALPVTYLEFILATYFFKKPYLVFFLTNEILGVSSFKLQYSNS